MPDPSAPSAPSPATLAADGAILDTWYPRPSLADHTPAGGTRHLTPEERARRWASMCRPLARDTRRKVEIVAVRTAIASLEEPPSDAHDAYLRLHLLSHRLIRPHDANLDGLFNVLSNVAWTSAGPARWTRSTRCAGTCAPPARRWKSVAWTRSRA